MDVATLADDIQESQCPALRKAQESLDEGITAIATRQKRIKLVDRSEFGWNVVVLYEQDELADDSEDEKKIYI